MASSRNSKIRTPPSAASGGEITIARHVSTSSETDPDPGRHHPMPHRTTRHYPEQLRPTPQQMPSLSIALPPRALALNIRIEPQILASRKRLHRNHIPHITRLNVHHQRINLLRRISRLPLPIHAINRLNFVSARVKRHLVCKRWTIEKADENSNGIPWFVLHRPNSDKLRFHLPSLPWHWFDA